MATINVYEGTDDNSEISKVLKIDATKKTVQVDGLSKYVGTEQIHLLDVTCSTSRTDKYELQINDRASGCTYAITKTDF